MAKTKIAITLDAALVGTLDRLVAEEQFLNRSQAIETLLAERLQRRSRTQLARACALLDVTEEQALAEEGIAEDAADWPEY
jgi:metal-responsive CopG/Arc/MetJ family transcriptional regulator